MPRIRYVTLWSAGVHMKFCCRQSRSRQTIILHNNHNHRSSTWIRNDMMANCGTRAKVIWYKRRHRWCIMTSGTAHGCLVDIFCRVHQVTARVAQLVLGCIWDPILGKGISDGTIWKSDNGFLQTLHCTIANHSAAICHRISPTLQSTVVGHFGATFGREGWLM